MNKHMIETPEGWTAPTLRPPGSPPDPEPVTRLVPAFVYRCRPCRRWYVRNLDQSQLCTCGHAGHHTATVNPHQWIESFLNADTEITAMAGMKGW
jgi:hypothetical protein